jgi:hypothetical protein
MSAIDLTTLTASTTTAAIARQIADQAAELAGFLDHADLAEDFDRSVYRTLADVRDRLARLAARIESAGPASPPAV